MLIRLELDLEEFSVPTAHNLLKVPGMKSRFIALTLFAVACGTSQSPSATSAPQAVQAVLGTSGGTLIASDGSEVSVPPGALLTDTVISMTPASDPPASAGAGEPAGATWLLGPEGQQFQLPVTVTVAFDPQKLDSYETEDDVLVYTSPQTNPSYSSMETVPVDATHVSVETTHFSTFSPSHHTRMFGLGSDAPTSLGYYKAGTAWVPGPTPQLEASNQALLGDLKKGWKSKQGHSLQTARIVFNIDNVDANTDNQNYKLLAEANGENVNTWKKNAAGGLASLQSWVDTVKGGGLVPVIAIAVSRFEQCREESDTKNYEKCPKKNGKTEPARTTSLGHDNFQDRFAYLLENYPDVRSWGFINEPDAAGFDAKDAVAYYMDGASVLKKMQGDGKAKGVSLFVGEFAYVYSIDGFYKPYWKSFGDDMIDSLKAFNDSHSSKDRLSFPRVWTFHPYKDTTGTKPKSNPPVLSPSDHVDFDTDGTSAYLDFLDGLEKKANLKKDTLRVWLTETGTMMEWAVGACADSRNNTAQYGGAKQVYTLAAKSRVDRVYWWQFEQGACDWGGSWDSGMVDWNDLPRPAFYALTNKPDQYPAVSVSRDCGGPGQNNCGGSSCCALCSKEAQMFSTYDPTSGAGLTTSCAAAAATFCAANADRGSVQSAMGGFCSALPAPTPPPSCGALGSGQSLVSPDEARACKGKYWLTLATNGDLVEVELDIGNKWDVHGQVGDHLDMQTDGNLVLYSKAGSPIWASNTSGNPGAYLDVQDDGNLVITYGSTPVCSLRGTDGTIAACP